MLERNVLQDRVEMLGPVRHEEVRDVMVRGHIYLHPSLTEAFGTVIVEAASCGLYVVCTRVGGIPEVLPEHMTQFARPEEDALVEATADAIAALRANKIHTERFHDQVRMMYSWTDVAERTERVYDGISGQLSEDEFYGHYAGVGMSAGRGKGGVQSFALIDRLKRYYGCGIWAGKLFCLCVVIDYLIFVVLELVFPRSGIDVARDWPKKMQPSTARSSKEGRWARSAAPRSRVEGESARSSGEGHRSGDMRSSGEAPSYDPTRSSGEGQGYDAARSSGEGQGYDATRSSGENQTFAEIRSSVEATRSAAPKSSEDAMSMHQKRVGRSREKKGVEGAGTGGYGR